MSVADAIVNVVSKSPTLEVLMRTVQFAMLVAFNVVLVVIVTSLISQVSPLGSLTGGGSAEMALITEVMENPGMSAEELEELTDMSELTDLLDGHGGMSRP